jgi:hypothetical protein
MTRAHGVRRIRTTLLQAQSVQNEDYEIVL